MIEVEVEVGVVSELALEAGVRVVSAVSWTDDEEGKGSKK